MLSLSSTVGCTRTPLFCKSWWVILPVISLAHLEFFFFSKGWKNLSNDNAERSVNDRYRILISDGKYSYAYGMLATQLNHLIIEGKLDTFSIIQVNKVICNRVTTKASAGKDPKKIIIILDLQILVPGPEVSFQNFLS